MKVPVRLRAGIADDVEAMYQLDLLCFAPPFRFDQRTLRRCALQPGAMVMVAESAQEIVGFVVVNLRNRGLLVGAYVATLDVHPAHRRAGLARLLMRNIERRAANNGATQIELHVAVENAAAVSFYEAAGYRMVTHVADYYAAGVDAWVYGKSLVKG